eukprot:m.7225 g.7225  ORF g.7225 m.7225 type:complete len:565 (+) comp6588_c0_seq2:117-1811(+)
MMRVLLLILLPCMVACWQWSGPNICALPPVVHVRPQDTCSDFGRMESPQHFDIFAAKGESESFQILLRDDDVDLEHIEVASIAFDTKEQELRAGTPLEDWSQVYQVGYVYCKHSPRYGGSGGGWRPDPLLTIPNGGVSLPKSTTQSLWFTFTIPTTAPSGNYSATISLNMNGHTLTNTTVSLNIVIANVTLPTLRESNIGTAWSGTWTPDHFAPYYNDTSVTKPFNLTQWYEVMVAHRMPPDSIYLSTPRPMADLEYLGDTVKVNWMAILDVSSLPLTPGGPPRTRHHGLGGSCANYSQEYVNRMISTLKPTVEQLQQKNLLQYAYVYGFDENPPSCEPQVRKLFGAVKKNFPSLRTVAVLNWSPMPTDLPVDVWVLQYESFNADDAKAWLDAGKAMWWYHCIEPSSLSNLNTFIERPLFQARALFWVALAYNVAYSPDLPPSGWLYYDVDLFKPYPGTTRAVMRRINGTGPYTDYDPGNYIWAPEYLDIFANGDGQFLYPGPDGPIPTTRLEAMRDGLEDWDLFLSVHHDPSVELDPSQIQTVAGVMEFHRLVQQHRRQWFDL